MFVARSVAILLVFLLISQATPQQASLALSKRATLARPLLLHAEAAASTATPATRAFLLYRAAGAWLDLDLAHAIELDRQAFTASRLIESPSLREAAEHDILSDILPLSPSTLLNLIFQAEPKTQNRLYEATINFSLMQSDLPEAVKAFDQASSAGIFSELVATRVLTAASQFNIADRERIFNEALAAYKAQTPKDSQYWSASRLVARFWQSLPDATVLSGIDILLDRAVEKDKEQPVGSGSIGSDNNSITYKSYTDLELFAVAPALKKYAPTRAAALLAAHPAVQEYLNRFPDGLPSFDTTFFYAVYSSAGHTPSIAFGKGSYASEKGAHSQNLSSLDMGLEFTIPLNLDVGLGVGGATVYFAPSGSTEAALLGTGNACPPDVPYILASIDTVPFSRRVPTVCGGPNGNRCSYEEEFPRAEILNKIAERCTYYPGKPAALATLAAELQLITQLPPDKRLDYLANAADLYLRLGDKEAAATVVQTGFDVATSLFAKDNKSTRLLGLPKAVWPSAEAYRRMISLGVNADFDRTHAAVEAISDPELRELERVMMARSLLGIPVRRQIVFYANGSSMTGHSESGYENF